MKKRIFAIVLCGVIHGCAKPPERIEAAVIDDAAYQNMSCETIRAQQSAYESDYKVLAQQQNNAATADAVGVLFLGVPGASLTGGDKETAVSILKGKMQALERVSARQGC